MGADFAEQCKSLLTDISNGLTYQTVLGVRYSELVKATADGWKYGRYVSTKATLQGGFLPVFWDVVKTTHERCGPFSLCRLEP